MWGGEAMLAHCGIKAQQVATAAVVSIFLLLLAACYVPSTVPFESLGQDVGQDQVILDTRGHPVGETRMYRGGATLIVASNLGETDRIRP